MEWSELTRVRVRVSNELFRMSTVTKEVVVIGLFRSWISGMDRGTYSYERR